MLCWRHSGCSALCSAPASAPWMGAAWPLWCACRVKTALGLLYKLGLASRCVVLDRKCNSGCCLPARLCELGWTAGALWTGPAQPAGWLAIATWHTLPASPPPSIAQQRAVRAMRAARALAGSLLGRLPGTTAPACGLRTASWLSQQALIDSWGLGTAAASAIAPCRLSWHSPRHQGHANAAPFTGLHVLPGPLLTRRTTKASFICLQAPRLARPQPQPPPHGQRTRAPAPRTCVAPRMCPFWSTQLAPRWTALPPHTPTGRPLLACTRPCGEAAAGAILGAERCMCTHRGAAQRAPAAYFIAQQGECTAGGRASQTNQTSPSARRPARGASLLRGPCPNLRARPPGRCRLTWREFKAHVDEVARGLLALGVQKRDRVGIWAPNSAEWVVLQYATAKVGALGRGGVHMLLRRLPAGMLLLQRRAAGCTCPVSRPSLEAGSGPQPPIHATRPPGRRLPLAPHALPTPAHPSPPTPTHHCRRWAPSW